MFIQTENTPNPNAVKFLPGCEISPAGPEFFHNIEQASGKTTLAVKLFEIAGVEAVFYGYDFITVTKTESGDWSLLRPEVLVVIMDHLVSGFPVFENLGTSTSAWEGKEMSEIEKQIIEIVENRVRPSVAMDGGDIIYRGFENGIVYLQLRGACSGCPSSSVTLKNGIESMLKHYVPEVISVEATEE